MSAQVFQATPVSPGIAIDGQKKLVVNTWTQTSGISISIRYMVQQPNQDTAVQQVVKAITTTNRTSQSFTLDLNPGVLTQVTLAAAVKGVQRGQLYAEIFLQQIGGSSVKLKAGYVTSGNDMTWPPDTFDSPTFGPGFISQITASPALGADISQAVPTNARWKIRRIFAKLVASSGVANRAPKFSLTNGTNVDYENVPGGATGLLVTASQTRTFLLLPGYSVLETAYDSNNETRVILPADLVMPSGYVFSSTTGAIQAGDQWTVFMDVEEWLEPTT